MEQSRINWRVIEHENKNKGVDWFWALGIIAVSLIAIAFILNNFLLAIFVAVSAFAVVIISIKTPRILDCEAGERGIIVDSTVYLYSSIEQFGIDNDKLILKTPVFLMPYVTIPLAEEIIEDLRDYLKKRRVKEGELYEPLSYRVMEYMGL